MVILLAMISCRTAIRSQTGTITGKVVWLEGNLMPSIGDPDYAARAAGRPIQRMLYIYEAATPEQSERKVGEASFYSEIHTKLIKKVRSGNDGTFSVKLPPGKYSVFSMEDEGLFANVFDGEGHISPVEVDAGMVSEIVIKINYKAYY